MAPVPQRHPQHPQCHRAGRPATAAPSTGKPASSSSTARTRPNAQPDGNIHVASFAPGIAGAMSFEEFKELKKRASSSSRSHGRPSGGTISTGDGHSRSRDGAPRASRESSSSAASAMSSQQPSLKSKSDSLHGHRRHKNQPPVTNENAAIRANAASKNAPFEAILSFDEFRELRRARRRRASSGRGNAASKSAASSSSGGSTNSSRRSIDGGGGALSMEEFRELVIEKGWRSSFESHLREQQQQQLQQQQQRKKGKKGGQPTKTSSTQDPIVSHSATTAKISNQKKKKKGGIKGINLNKIREVLQGASLPDALGGGAHSARGGTDGAAAEFASQGFGKERTKVDRHVPDGAAGRQPSLDESPFPDVWEKKKEKEEVHTKEIKMKTERNTIRKQDDNHDDANDPIGSHVRVPPPGRDRTHRQPHPNHCGDADHVPTAVMSTLTDEDGANSDTGNNGSVANHSAINASKEQQQQQRQQQQQHRPIAKSVKQATKHMVQATTYVASNVVGPKLASAASHAASSAANTVAEAATTALNGANILAKGDVDVVDVMTGTGHGSGGASAAASTDAASSSMANAKTPARSNVTRKLFKHHHQHHDGKGSHNTHHDDPLQSQVSTASQPPRPPQRYADYVTDPDYHVVLTPPPPLAAARNQTLHQPPANHFSTPAHRKYACDPSTPACLIGAVAAGRCHLSEDHPDHPEYIPKDIPRLLIVPEDWEERAGFVATSAGASDRKHSGNGAGPIEIAADGRNKSERYHRASTARTTFDTNDNLSTRHVSRSGSNAPVSIPATETTTTEGGLPYIVPCPSNPIDVDEVDDEENNSDHAIAEEKHENDDVDDYDDNHDVGKENSTLTNEVYNDDDTRVIRGALRIGREVNRETMLALREGVEMKGRTVVRQNTMQDEDVDQEEDDDEVDDENDDPRNHSMWVAVPDMDEEEEDDLDPSDVVIGDLDDGFNDVFESVTPKSEGSGTYFIGEVCVDEHDEDGLIIESAVSGDDSYGNIGDIHIEFSPVGNDIVTACDFAVEDASDDDDNDDDREDDTNKSEKEGEDQEVECQPVELVVPSHEQRDTKGVLFGKEKHDDEFTGNQIHPESAHDCEPISEQLHEHREHQIIVHGSYCSEFENPFALNEEENNAAANVVLSFDDDTVKGSGKRVLKGRVLFVRIGKKISKVKSRGKNVLQQVFVLRPFGKGKNGEVHQDGSGSEDAREMREDQVVLTIPENPSLPHSPSSVSVASISSSVLTGGTNTKRNLGAVPVYSVPKAENPYGTINYNRSSTESTTNGSDALPPPPPEGNSFPIVPTSGSNDDDAISLLAAAIAASRDARVVDQEKANEKTQVENTEATEEAKEMEQEDESSVFLVVTPDDGGPTEAFQVVSSIDGITPVRDINEITGEHSEIRPSNLSCIFACNSQGSQRAASIQIMDAAAGGIDLTPTAVNQNFASVFRNGPPASVAPTNGEFSNLLPSPAAESGDEEEEETLLHDGCTVIHQASTFGDHTIATTTSAPPQAADDDKEQKFISSDDTYASIREQVINESRAIAARVGSFEFSPEPKPSLCRQAAKNGSFLFSPDNMGRAGPRIRARERLALKQGNVAPSITMLPAADKTTKSEQSTKLAVTEKRSYSSEVSSEETVREAMIIMQPAIEIKKSEADSESLDAGGSRSSIEVEVQKKAVMSSVTEPRLFSFKSTLSKFDLYAEGSESSTPVVEGNSLVADEEIANAPTVEKVSTPRADDQSKKTYPTTPFPENMPEKETIDSPKPTVAFPTSVLSPTNSTSSKASSGRKKSPRTKTIPKSALKTKKGLVKERVSDIQQRLDSLSAVTGVNGRLKRNHSYRLRSPRRLTNGDGKLAPRKPVLQNPMFIRSVPIGITKSYSRDESDNIPQYVEQKNSFDKATIATDIIREKEEEQYDEHADLYSDEEDTNLHYSSKYLSNIANAIGVISPTNLESESHSPVQSLLDCDSSSFVSEATEYDAFNALLGKLNDCGSSSSEGSDDSHTVEKTLFGSAQTDKENAEANNFQSLSSDNFLPFKQDGLVRPTEINQHDKRSALATMATRDLQLSPLQRTPVQARKWRTMAAAAAQNKSGSVRFK